MIILLSPAKTFSKTPSVSYQKPMFLDESIVLQEKLKKLSCDEIKTKMHLSSKLSDTVYNYYQKLGTTHYKAIEAYQGQVYKSLDYLSLKTVEKKYIHKHVRIISGLYGMLSPEDGISYYRLEMQDQVITNLYHYWNKILSSYIDKHASKEIFVSLCSLEYEKVFDHIPIITIDFISKAKLHAMALKTLRGLFVKQMAIQNVQSLNELKQITVDGFIYSEKSSTSSHFTFKKD